MKFKEEHMKAQYEGVFPKLREICEYFEQLASACGRDAIVTRVTDTVPGESGVHTFKRAVDFRDDFESDHGTVSMFTDEEAQTIVDEINKKYPRADGKLVCIHHSFEGGPHHFHIQIPYEWAV